MRRFWDAHHAGLERVGWGVETFAATLGPLVADRDVLELGCGAGGLSHCLSRTARSIVGVDFTPALIGAARTAAAANTTFLEADILTLNLQRRFDLITGAAILHEIPAAQFPALVDVLTAHLEPGGACFFMENNFFNPVYRLVRRRLVGRFWVRKVGSANETPFDAARFELLRSRFTYVERFCDVFVCFERAWGQFAHPLALKIAPRLSLRIKNRLGRIDQALTRAGGSVFWTWTPTIYCSNAGPRAAWTRR